MRKRSLSRFAGSGFRLQAPASLTPAKRLNIDGWSDSVIEYIRAAEPAL